MLQEFIEETNPLREETTSEWCDLSQISLKKSNHGGNQNTDWQVEEKRKGKNNGSKIKIYISVSEVAGPI